MILDKQYARRPLEGYQSPYDDPFTYRSITELDRGELLAIMQQTMDGSLCRDMTDEPAAPKFDGMVEHAEVAFDPSYWLVAYLDDEPAGLVFAQRYYDKMEEGSIFMIGLIEHYRGKGYGKILHAKGLAMLGEMGCTGYIGSTDIENPPMLKIFQQNGCNLTRIRRIEYGEGIPVTVTDSPLNP